MKQAKVFCTVFFSLFLAWAFTTYMGWAQNYELSIAELEKYKKSIDDPAPFYKNIEGYKKIMPPEAYKKVTYDVEAMKNTWA